MRPFLPKVTVVIPLYNAEEFIERAVCSAVAQTYSNLQILVINDGSTDNSRRIVEDLCDQFPNLTIKTVANGGVARARNLGTEMADDGYVAYLDADDLWHPSKIEKQVAAMARHEGDSSWAACYSGFRKIWTDDTPIKDGVKFGTSGDFFAEHLLVNHVGNGSSLMVRRDVALEVGGFDPSFAERRIGGCEDRDLQLKILQKYKVECVPEFLVGYRIHPQGMSSNTAAMALGQIAVIESFLSDPRVDPFLRRQAMSAVHRSAVLKFWNAGDRSRALRSFLLNVWLDPFGGALRGIRRVSAITVGRMVYALWRVTGFLGEGTERRNFMHLDPARSLAAQAFRSDWPKVLAPSGPPAATR